MSGSSSYNTYESEDESTGWLMTSETSVDDELSDELTLLNGDEDCDEDTLSFEALIKLSMRLKKQYNLREATVQLARCDKIWDTMQLVKQMQMDNEVEAAQTADGEIEEDETEAKYTPQEATVRSPERAHSSIPYIKYQPVQGNGNNALPNFYLAVKSQKKLYNCVTCGKQYSEERSLRLHSQKEHGVVMPKATKKSRRSADIKPASQDSAEHKPVNNPLSRDRDNAKSRLSSTSKHSTEQHSHRKHDSKTTESSSNALPELKKESETRWADDTREKPFICPICSTAYTYQRSMTTHMMNVHDMTLEEARSAYLEGDTVTTTKPLTKKEISQKLEGIKKESVKKEDAETVPRPRYIYTCKPCGKRYTEKNYLRSHAKKNHNIIIPVHRKTPLSIVGEIKEYAHYTCETKRPPGELVRARVEVTKEEDKSYVRSIAKDETQQQPRTMRSGRLIGDGPVNANRPRRACAANTSYTECTKSEEEEALHREPISSNTAGESAKASNSQTTPCFLCKKAFVDIRKHLVDYHRINCPETVLPLATNVVESEKETASIASSETIESLPETIVKTTKKPTRVKETDVKLKDNNEYIRLINKTSSVWNPKRYQCVLCAHKYNRRSHVQRHLVKHTINGVVQEHAPEKRRRRKKVVKAPLVDPLALTDFAESSRSESQGNPTDEDNAQTTAGRKRVNSSEDERRSSNYERLNKRRKLEEPQTFINPGSDTTSDSVQYNNERETVLVMADTDSRFNEEEKTGNPRDTRDSSDRDSGIGISITIKKRNNSYEVVEKDSGDDDKSKDFEHSKDDNTCSDSSSDVTPVVFVNDDQEARRREILNSLDYNAEENVVASVRDDYVVLDAFAKKTEEESCSSDDKEANYCWKEGEHYEKDACASLLGNVPSLKVMCATVLKKDELTNLNSNHSISHQCPVCYRFYPTERDVTVHMLEHKVSRTDFRPTRIHAIPSSALRRYGRRPV